MTRISGKISNPLWPFVVLVFLAGVMGWLVSGPKVAFVAILGAILGCGGFAFLRSRALFEVYQEKAELVFVSPFARVMTSWGNIRKVHICAPENEGEWHIVFHFIKPVAGRLSIAAIGDGPCSHAPDFEKAAITCIQKYREA